MCDFGLAFFGSAVFEKSCFLVISIDLGVANQRPAFRRRRPNAKDPRDENGKILGHVTKNI